jgi:hypothetical protein
MGVVRAGARDGVLNSPEFHPQDCEPFCEEPRLAFRDSVQPLDSKLYRRGSRQKKQGTEGSESNVPPFRLGVSSGQERTSNRLRFRAGEHGGTGVPRHHTCVEGKSRSCRKNSDFDPASASEVVTPEAQNPASKSAQ